jgi:hypothetical protein
MRGSAGPWPQALLQLNRGIDAKLDSQCVDIRSRGNKPAIHHLINVRPQFKIGTHDE